MNTLKLNLSELSYNEKINTQGGTNGVLRDEDGGGCTPTPLQDILDKIY